MTKTNLASFNNNWYRIGTGRIKQFMWYVVNLLMFNSYWLPFSRVKVLCLRLFGAKVGKGCVIKPKVNIKYPWKLTLGDYVWIGEGVWIDNLALVSVGNHVCLSQGSMLLCGNHNYQKSSFDLMVGEIHLEDGAWVGAKTIVCPGVKVATHAVLSVGSVLTQNTKAYTIYQGNPAKAIKERIIRES